MKRAAAAGLLAAAVPAARVLRISVVLAALFNAFALLVLLWNTPVAFTAFLFFGQALFVVAVLLLLGAVLADLKARGFF